MSTAGTDGSTRHVTADVSLTLAVPLTEKKIHWYHSECCALNAHVVECVNALQFSDFSHTQREQS